MSDKNMDYHRNAIGNAIVALLNKQREGEPEVYRSGSLILSWAEDDSGEVFASATYIVDDVDMAKISEMGNAIINEDAGPEVVAKLASKPGEPGLSAPGLAAFITHRDIAGDPTLIQENIQIAKFMLTPQH